MSSQPTPALLPCPLPWCNGTAQIIEDYDDYHPNGDTDYHVKCKKCKTRSPEFATRELAMAAWNTRSAGWTRVEDALPRHGQCTIVSNHEGVHAAYFDGEVEGWYDFDNEAIIGVIAWMELPTPYTGSTLPQTTETKP